MFSTLFRSFTGTEATPAISVFFKSASSVRFNAGRTGYGIGNVSKSAPITSACMCRFRRIRFVCISLIFWFHCPVDVYSLRLCHKSIILKCLIFNFCDVGRRWNGRMDSISTGSYRLSNNTSCWCLAAGNRQWSRSNTWMGWRTYTIFIFSHILTSPTVYVSFLCAFVVSRPLRCHAMPCRTRQ